MLTLDEVRKRCEPVFAARPIERAWVFGSYARGEQDEDSDVDICYDLVEGGSLRVDDGEPFASMRGFAAFQHTLEDSLGLPVDVCLKPGPRGNRAHARIADIAERLPSGKSDMPNQFIGDSPMR